MMKTRTLLGTLVLGVSIPGMTLFAQTEGEIESPTFELDLQEETQRLKEATNAAKPLQETLGKGMKKLDKALENYKNNPSMVTKSKFERVYAENVQDIVNDMDQLFRYQDQATWAFNDIQKKIEMVSKTLEHNQKRAQNRVQRHAEDVNQLVDKVQELRRKIKAKGKENVSQEMKNELKSAMYKLKFKKKNFQLMKRLRGEQKGIQQQLKQYKGSVSRIGNNLDAWYDSLKSVRSALLERAKTGQDMAELRKMLYEGGPQSINRMMGNIQGMMDDLNDLNSVLAKGYDVMNKTSGTRFSVAGSAEEGGSSIGNLLEEAGDVERVETGE